MDVQEMTWKRKKLLSLMVQMDNYSDYLLLWSPRDKKLWYLDIEHEEFHPLAKWDDFIANVPFPVSWTVKMKKKQKETQDILSYHTQAAGCSDKARAKASGGRQPIEECGRTGL